MRGVFCPRTNCASLCWARPQRQAQPRLQRDEHHRAVFKLLADYALSRKTQTIAVKMQGRLQTIHAQSDDGDLWLPLLLSLVFLAVFSSVFGVLSRQNCVSSSFIHSNQASSK